MVVTARVVPTHGRASRGHWVLSQKGHSVSGVAPMKGVDTPPGFGSATLAHLDRLRLAWGCYLLHVVQWRARLAQPGGFMIGPRPRHMARDPQEKLS